MIIHISEPADGWTLLERSLIRLNVIALYQRIPDPTDKFILLSTQEADYNQEELAQILGISQEAISKRLTKTLGKLRTLREAGKL